MAKTGPIILLEDDTDDQELVQEGLREIGVENKLIFFTNAIEALEYLSGTTEHPFIIISDVNLPGMSVLTFKKAYRTMSIYVRRAFHLFSSPPQIAVLL